MAEIVGTSTATVMRLATKIGYTGYAEFQKDLQELLRDRVAPTTRLEINAKSLSKNSIIVKCEETQVANIAKTASFLTDETMNAFHKLVKNAHKIYIIGVRSSYAPAYQLYHELNQILGNCELLKAARGDNVTTMLNITREDLIIAITLPRYAKTTIDIVNTLKKLNPKIIGITDGYNSPLAAVSDLILPCAFRSHAFHNSIVGLAFLIDFLITSVALNNPEKTRNRLDAAEVFFKEMDIMMD
jgi:DNA-binding MurR/RpiR family transcriptional regulator